ncbi:PfkB family carbohydrate kinase [Bacteroidales bacterium OttesenSCG-928-B11]|nr:PfkB family carbohydrate kinase [Bacteroidales bacterium OttesenSCG-928-C03]MDL2312387.1 PfkB family carbohydrate kinase [Bacteroidales bacterium OttesenSCG-928-B11]MDL2326643.1 PfkB family carbohydrate kinase [Bacteroidales bacterium OttesenSCG-928-A14]
MDLLLKSFQDTTVLIVGDVMIDCYLRGKVTGISPEAPVPVVRMQQRENRLGGAANVAANIKALGANPILCSVIGNDSKKEILVQELAKQEIQQHLLIEEANRRTTVKYRIISNQIQMLRVDDEDIAPITTQNEYLLFNGIRQIIDRQKVDALIFVDYDKGVLSPSLIGKIVTLCNEHGIITAVDPKKANFHHYEKVTLFKPNRKEFQEGLGLAGGNLTIEELHEQMEKFALRYDIMYMMITLSEEGVAIYNRKNNEFTHQPTYQRSISDVSGAGDTVMSVATLALKAGVPIETIAQLANLGGGVVCEHAGVVPLSSEMLKNEFHKRKENHNI